MCEPPLLCLTATLYPNGEAIPYKVMEIASLAEECSLATTGLYPFDHAPFCPYNMPHA